MTETWENVDDKSTDQNAIREHPQEIIRLLNHYEALVVEIQREARKCREQNVELKKSLLSIIDENKQLRASNEEIDHVAEFRVKHIAINEHIQSHLQKQIALVHREKEMYEQLWRRTSSVLEQEIPRNSIAKLRTEHTMEVRQLRKDLGEAQTECKREKEVNAALRKAIKEMLGKLQTNQEENKCLHDEIAIHTERVKALEANKTETEQLLQESNELNREQMKKATESFEKMQETIRVAEHAMAEAEHLAHEKRRIEAEYNHLAETIGSVMEQASERVDKDLDDMQRRHGEEIARLKAEVERLQHTTELERERKKSAMHQASAVKEKLQSTDKANSFLGKDLEDALRRLEAAEGDILRLKEIADSEREQRKQAEYEVEKLRSVIKHNRKINLKWKDIMLDITRQVQEKIKNLMLENQELRTSRQSL